MSVTILAVGLMVFFAHFLSLQFRKTSIPDVLVLMLAGIVLGPLLGIATPQDFGKVGSLIATIALVVILFEGGTSLDLGVLVSITLTALLVMLYPQRMVQRLYARTLKKTLPDGAGGP